MSGGREEPRFVVMVSDLQNAVEFPADQPAILEGLGVRVLAGILERKLAREPLPQAVEVSLVDDEAISKVHGEFMDDPTPTDVITFPYGEFGEILISLETASRQGLEHGRTLEEEAALYLVHGLLHLSGYTDKTASEHDEMAEIQEYLLTQYL